MKGRRSCRCDRRRPEPGPCDVISSASFRAAPGSAATNLSAVSPGWYPRGDSWLDDRPFAVDGQREQADRCPVRGLDVGVVGSQSALPDQVLIQGGDRVLRGDVGEFDPEDQGLLFLIGVLPARSTPELHGRAVTDRGVTSRSRSGWSFPGDLVLGRDGRRGRGGGGLHDPGRDSEIVRSETAVVAGSPFDQRPVQSIQIIARVIAWSSSGAGPGSRCAWLGEAVLLFGSQILDMPVPIQDHLGIINS